MRFVAIACVAVLAAPVARAEPHQLGVMADLGLPDGAVVALAYRPHRVVATHLGLGHNANGLGLRAGAWLVPWPGRVAPYLALEAGHYFATDTPTWLQDAARDAGLEDKTLERVGYSFASGQLGARFGGATALYLQAGVSWIDATSDYVKPKPNYTPPVDLYREVEVRLWIVSGHAGVLHEF